VYKGNAKPKADVTIILSDDTLTDLASGKVWSNITVLSNHGLMQPLKLNGQRAFMTGKLKTKGNIMLATKLDGVLKVRASSYQLFPIWQPILHTEYQSKTMICFWDPLCICFCRTIYVYIPVVIQFIEGR
jgi:hypothetical protein